MSQNAFKGIIKKFNNEKTNLKKILIDYLPNNRLFLLDKNMNIITIEDLCEIEELDNPAKTIKINNKLSNLSDTVFNYINLGNSIIVIKYRYKYPDGIIESEFDINYLVKLDRCLGIKLEIYTNIK